MKSLDQTQKREEYDRCRSEKESMMKERMSDGKDVCQVWVETE